MSDLDTPQQQDEYFPKKDTVRLQQLIKQLKGLDTGGLNDRKNVGRSLTWLRASLSDTLKAQSHMR